MSFARFRSRFGGGTKNEQEVTTTSTSLYHEEVTDGSLHYVVDKAENDTPTTYQEASGAPVETKSPLGYAVGPITIVFLNLSKMVGTGIYSTRKYLKTIRVSWTKDTLASSILSGTGSVGLSLIYWLLGYIISLTSLAVYLEYASYFPNRSGSEVVYLEQTYPRPKYFFPIAFAVQTVVLSFSSSNSIVLAKYLFATNGHTGSNWQVKGVALAGYTVACLRKYSYASIQLLILTNTSGFIPYQILLRHFQWNWHSETPNVDLHRHHWSRCSMRSHQSC